MRSWLIIAVGLFLAFTSSVRADVIVVEGETFLPQDAKGWKATHQQDSYGSHTYGGMWMSQGGCLGAPADSVGSVAMRVFDVKEAGAFRVWSKYQAPPYFHFLHQIDIVQNGKTVFTHVYGKKGTDRLWSFSGESDELWWPWGVDHDAAEAPKQTATLAAGQAEIRLTTVANAKPAGDRFIDFVLLTTNLKDDYKGFKPNAVGSPFANEALDATKLYFRFQNTSDIPARLTVSRAGHFQPQYGGATAMFPTSADPKAKEQPSVAPGQWSAWFDIGPFCRLVHDEGLTLSLGGTKEFGVQFSRTADGKNLVGDLKAVNGDAAVVPIDITWHKDAVVKTSRQHAREIIADSKTWRKLNGGKRPQEILYYGAFSGNEDWVHELKAALGYNTHLPDKYGPVKVSNLHAHAHNPAEIQAYAKTLKDKDRLRVLSFGDEISLGTINFKDAKLQEKFRAWLKTKGITKADLGVDPGEASLSPEGNPRLAWFTQQFNEEERFAAYREMTKLAKELIGPHVLTGANYSPHHGTLYYGPIYQWVDIFKQQGMTMFWAEDYVFSVPEVPQIVSWSFGQMRCATKYHNQPIHYYVMPHAPGQEPGFLNRSMRLAIGYGTRHIDNFWVAPAERFTENYVGWTYRDTFRALGESIFDSAEVEKVQAKGKVRPARVAVVMSKATDFNESKLMVDKALDPFAAVCKNAPKTVNQTLCRKDQQMLFLALKHAQHAVDCVTEEDILEGYLKNLDVVYFAGEWIDQRIIPKLEAWVKDGGVLYACAGLGHRNQYNEPEPAMLKLLGLKDAKLTKNAYHLRTLLELPLCEPIDQIKLDGQTIPAVAMKQTLVPETAKVLGTWSDGSAAVTVHALGKGKTFAVGTGAGTAYMKSALKPIPFARGGRHTVYNPVDYSPASKALVRLGIEARAVDRFAECSNELVEAIVMDAPEGTLLTLVNWTNQPLVKLRVQVRTPGVPKTVRAVGLQLDLPFTTSNGVVTFEMPALRDADYVLLR
jgi:hypothetical protein